jgi:hypothetical protein
MPVQRIYLQQALRGIKKSGDEINAENFFNFKNYKFLFFNSFAAKSAALAVKAIKVNDGF